MIPNFLKAITITAVLPLITMADPAAGKAISDTKDALADKHLTTEEVEKILGDGVALAKEHLPAEWHPALDALTVNINVDIPNIEKTVLAFQALANA